MKIINKLILLSLFIVLITGCSYDELDKHNKNIDLTEKQIEILVDNEINRELTSTDLEQLDIIEDALQYLENKYNKDFGFIQYNEHNLLNDGYMLAYSKTDDKYLDSFAVWANNETYEDTYMNKAIRFEFRDYIKDEVDTLTKNTPSEVIVDVCSTSLTDIPTDYKEFNDNVESSIWIFLDGEYFSVSQTEELEDKLKEWLNKQRIYGVVHIILLNNNSLSYVNNHNFNEYLTEDDYKIKHAFSLNRVN